LSSEPFETCRKCGAVMQRVSEENESPLIMECRDCSHREHAEVQISPDDFFDNNEPEYRRVLVYREDDKTNAKEVRGLRKLIPELGGLPMTAAIKRIEESRHIDLGFHSLDDAQELIQQVESLGLTVLVLPQDETPIDDQDNSYRLFEPFGAPVSVGEPGVDSIVIPFVWILIAAALVVALLVWLLL